MTVRQFIEFLISTPYSNNIGRIVKEYNVKRFTLNVKNRDTSQKLFNINKCYIVTTDDKGFSIEFSSFWKNKDTEEAISEITNEYNKHNNNAKRTVDDILDVEIIETVQRNDSMIDIYI